MAKTLFAVSTAALIVACIAGWAIPNTQARIAQAATGQVDSLLRAALAPAASSGLFC